MLKLNLFLKIFLSASAKHWMKSVVYTRSMVSPRRKLSGDDNPIHLCDCSMRPAHGSASASLIGLYTASLIFRGRHPGLLPGRARYTARKA